MLRPVTTDQSDLIYSVGTRPQHIEMRRVSGRQSTPESISSTVSTCSDTHHPGHLRVRNRRLGRVSNKNWFAQITRGKRVLIAESQTEGHTRLTPFQATNTIEDASMLLR